MAAVSRSEYQSLELALHAAEFVAEAGTLEADKGCM